MESKLHKVAAERRGNISPVIPTTDSEENKGKNKIKIHSLVNGEKELPKTPKDEPDKSGKNFSILFENFLINFLSNNILVPKQLPVINYERIKQNIEYSEAKIRAMT